MRFGPIGGLSVRARYHTASDRCPLVHLGAGMRIAHVRGNLVGAA